VTTIEETAYHEAGHVVVALATEREFVYATIEPDRDGLGHVRPSRPDRDETVHLGQSVLTALGGAIAVLIHGGEEPDPGQGGGKLGRLYLQARALVAENWGAVEALAQALIRRRTVTYAEAKRLFRTAGASPAPATRRIVCDLDEAARAILWNEIVSAGKGGCRWPPIGSRRARPRASAG